MPCSANSIVSISIVLLSGAAAAGCGLSLLVHPTAPPEPIPATPIASTVVWQTPLDGAGASYLCTDGDSVATSTLIAFGKSDGFDLYDLKGQKVRSVTLDAQSGLPYYEFGLENGKPILIRFETWSESLTAYDLTGAVQWTFLASGPGIDWVAPVKTDPSNTDFAISYNGGGGVELISSSGESQWKHELPVNGWSITGLRRGAGAQPIVATNGASDAAAFYDIAGRALPSIKVGDFGAVGAADIDGSGSDALLTLGTTVSSGMKLSAFDPAGKLRWSASASFGRSAFNTNPFVVGHFAKGRTLIGVTTSDALELYSIDGKAVGQMPVGCVSVLHNSHDEDHLIAWDGHRLICYKLGG